ncbi:MAG: helix-turn-helix domain-containing protein [Rhodococcus sp. (in: high G+C Gram-positive bacteria)]
MTATGRDTSEALHRRPEIELAWHRAAMSGLDPGMDVRERTIADVDTRSSLTLAAGPVLDKMVDDLADTRFSILLADRTSRIVDRRVGDRTVGQALDRVLAVPGFQYLEEVSGTNSLATAFELRKPIAVTGDEHFLEALKLFACYGAPIIHPITHRIEGVIDVSGPVSDATTLLGPFLMRATRDIEQRLLEGSRIAEKQLLAEFQSHSNKVRHAVVALGENLVLANTAAADLVRGVDHVALRAIASELTTRSDYEGSLVLASGLPVAVRASSVAGSNGGVLFEITEKSAPQPERLTAGFRATPTTASAAAAPPLSRVVLVTGEPGTGKTTTALKIAGEARASFDSFDSIGTKTQWFADVRSALSHPEASVVIDNIDALEIKLVRQLSAVVSESACSVVLTSIPIAELSNPHRALASQALTRRELQPLRSYPHKLVSIVKSVVSEVAPGSAIEFAPSVFRSLAQHDWPGNLRELRAVIDFAVRGRDSGVVTELDLPQVIRPQPRAGRALTLMEAAERDAIVAALRASRGNKTIAADALGIGRTTLYSRIQRYKIVGP